MKDLERILMSLANRPMGLPRKLLDRIDSPIAKALSALDKGTMSLDEKRRIVRQMQIANLNNPTK